jgi:molybdopterin converting factor small subunit
MTRVRLFGAFRKYVGNETHIVIELKNELPVSEVKKLITQVLRERNSSFNEEQLVADSALANEEFVFNAKDLVPPGGEIAILPPVCGG